MSTLLKPVVQVYVPGTAGSPGNPGQPYLPARTAVESRTVCEYVATDPVAAAAAQGVIYTYDFRGATSADGVPIKTWGYNWPPGVYGFGYPKWTYQCRTVQTLVRYPAQNYIPPSAAVPATPGQFLQQFRLGWSGRAISRAARTGPARFTFRAPVATVGAVVGLSVAPATSGIGDIRGFMLARGIARIYEDGAEVAYLGSHTSEDVFGVRRAAGRIQYFKNGELLRDAAAPAGQARLAAALYSGGDTVLDATALPAGDGAASMRALSSFGGNVKSAAGVGAMLPLTSTGGELYGGRASMKPLSAVGGKAYGQGAGAMLPLQAFSEGMAAAPAYSIGSGSFGYLNSTGSALAGQVASGAASMQPLTGIGGKAYGQGRASMAPLIGYGFSDGEPNRAVIFSRAFSGADVGAVLNLYVLMASGAQASSILVGQTLLTAELRSSATTLGTLTAAQIIHALLSSTVRLSTLQFDDAGDLATWVMNTKTGGTTRYEGYGFNSFAKVGGRYFGARAGGIYELVGATDAGKPVPARINFGNSNFGTAQLKGITEVYVGASSTAGVVVKVVAGGQAFFYTARSSSELLATHRVDLGRGLCENYFELELQNSDGGPLELASIEFTPVPFSRRI